MKFNIIPSTDYLIEFARKMLCHFEGKSMDQITFKDLLDFIKDYKEKNP